MRTIQRWGIALGLLYSALAGAEDFRARLPEDEIVYFLLPDRFENGDPKNDRGGLRGDRLATGFDPGHKGFYHGGDLRGLIERLDYIQGLGATAIWLGPIYKNKPVQGSKGQESAGYHGYWITDFTRVDEHFGTNKEMKAFVDAAHARGIKVYLDIITNHTADVISYRQCPDSTCPYRSRADYPYARAAGTDGSTINAGFLGESVATQENFARLTRTDFAYDVFVPPAEAKVKVPAWLNDPLWYHNRGNSTFTGESSTMGDFVGLDDLMTENPRVVQGFIEIYGRWIEEFGIDGFRIDTARHVNPEFWTAFAPAMTTIARSRGIPNFHIFGEVATDHIDPAMLARATRVDRLPTVLDFAFRAAVVESVAKGSGSDKMVTMFNGDSLYEGGEATALRLPTFVSNHDAGRFAHYVRKHRSAASDAEVLQRTLLAHAMMFTLRGVPVVYAGDEQGFVGDGIDQDAREDMFPSKVASYNDNVLLGTKATTAQSNFDRSHPIYTAIAQLSALRREHPALRRGKQIIRNYGDQPGLFAVSRIDPQTRREILVVFNTSATPLQANVEVDARTKSFTALKGSCAAQPTVPGSYKVTLEPLSYAICAARDAT
ncbi:MAG: alpha-amylase family glycosyl hydrolase [Steroidobacter sp.]